MNKFDYRVPYADTDNMGVVYYANYLIYFERGRTELLRQIGYTYKEMEEKGLYFPIRNVECNYHSPAHYDDMITIETTLSEIRSASVVFHYVIKCQDKLLVTGMTKHPLVDYSFKPTRLPQDLKDMLEQHLEVIEK